MFRKFLILYTLIVTGVSATDIEGDSKKAQPGLTKQAPTTGIAAWSGWPLFGNWLRIAENEDKFRNWVAECDAMDQVFGTIGLALESQKLPYSPDKKADLLSAQMEELTAQLQQDMDATEKKGGFAPLEELLPQAMPILEAFKVELAVLKHLVSKTEYPAILSTATPDSIAQLIEKAQTDNVRLFVNCFLEYERMMLTDARDDLLRKLFGAVVTVHCGSINQHSKDGAKKGSKQDLLQELKAYEGYCGPEFFATESASAIQQHSLQLATQIHELNTRLCSEVNESEMKKGLVQLERLMGQAKPILKVFMPLFANSFLEYERTMLTDAKGGLIRKLFCAIATTYCGNIDQHSRGSAKKRSKHDLLQELKAYEEYCSPEFFAAESAFAIRQYGLAEDVCASTRSLEKETRRNHKNNLLRNLARKVYALPSTDDTVLNTNHTQTSYEARLLTACTLMSDPVIVSQTVQHIKQFIKSLQEKERKASSLESVYKLYGKKVGKPPLELLARDTSFMVRGGDANDAQTYLRAYVSLRFPGLKNENIEIRLMKGDESLLQQLYQETKAAQKANAHARQVAEIRAQQQAALATAAAKATPPVKKAKPQAVPTPVTPLSGTETVQRKEQDLKDAATEVRHNAADTIQREKDRKKAKRDRQKKSKATAKQSATPAATPEGDSKKASLGEIVKLSSTPKDVQREINNNTWNFTREDFRLYLENLGFSVINGGKHVKAAMPEVLFIEREGKMIAAVLTEFNADIGSLTLPRWEKSPLPYLQSQITTALEKVHAFLAQVKQNAGTTVSSDR